jgi:hypothetical protein
MEAPAVVPLNVTPRSMIELSYEYYHFNILQIMILEKASIA